MLKIRFSKIQDFGNFLLVHMSKVICQLHDNDNFLKTLTLAEHFRSPVNLKKIHFGVSW